jgi:transposase-like protein
MRGKKGEPHPNWWDPPRRRANKRRGHGTFELDRPPILGSIGRQSGEVRLRVGSDTTWVQCRAHIAEFTRHESQVYTDEWGGYNGIRVDSVDLGIRRHHSTVHHGKRGGVREWARDDDGDGIREVHINTIEGLWAQVRTFLRPLRGVHKCYLSGYIAICEWQINLKRITRAFICALVAQQLTLLLAVPRHLFQP